MAVNIPKRRKELRSELALIEKQIYDLETTYLDETKDIGNIFTGWDNYLSKEKIKVKKVISNDERLFSLSSVTSPASRNEERKKLANLSGRKNIRKNTYKKKVKDGLVGDSLIEMTQDETEATLEAGEDQQDLSEMP